MPSSSPVAGGQAKCWRSTSVTGARYRHLGSGGGLAVPTPPGHGRLYVTLDQAAHPRYAS